MPSRSNNCSSHVQPPVHTTAADSSAFPSPRNLRPLSLGLTQCASATACRRPEHRAGELVGGAPSEYSRPLRGIEAGGRNHTGRKPNFQSQKLVWQKYDRSRPTNFLVSDQKLQNWTLFLASQRQEKHSKKVQTKNRPKFEKEKLV